MSDSGSDDEDYGSEVEEDEEKSSEGEEENESPEDKAAKILNDIDTIKDIFLYIDNTTQRLRSRIQWEDEKEQYQQELETMEEVVKHNKAKGSSGNDATKNIAGKNEEYEATGNDISWSQYEDYDDAQRAELLEKAIRVLGT